MFIRSCGIIHKKIHWLPRISTFMAWIPPYTWRTTNLRRCTLQLTGVTTETGTAYPSGAPEFTPGFLWGPCYSIFSFICMFCRLLFVLLYFFFWPLCSLFFFDIRILITPLVSSNSSCSNFYIPGIVQSLK